MGRRYRYEYYPEFEDQNRYDLEWRESHFIAKLCNQLPEVCFAYFPELELHREHILPTLIKHTQTIGEDVNHFFMVINYQVKNNISYKVTPLPKRQTEEDLQKKIEDFFTSCKQEIHCKCSVRKDYKRIHDEKNFIEDFKMLLHKKIKEILIEFYPRIYDFSSYGFRQIDSLLYWECVDRVFYQSFMDIAENLIENRFPEFEFETDPEYLEEPEQSYRDKETEAEEN